jgi:hypothetical protein
MYFGLRAGKQRRQRPLSAPIGKRHRSRVV